MHRARSINRAPTNTQGRFIIRYKNPSRQKYVLHVYLQNTKAPSVFQKDTTLYTRRKSLAKKATRKKKRIQKKRVVVEMMMDEGTTT